jgi:hypothetical protein
MPQAANALHGDQISTAQAGVAKSVVGGDTRAEERGGIYGTELVRNRSNGARFSDHHFRVSSIHGHSQYNGVLTIHNVSASARFAHPVFAADQADTNPLTDFPSGHSDAQGFNAANHFMPGNAWKTQTRVDTGDRGRIGVTDSACFNTNANLARSRLRDRPFHYSKHAGCRDFDCFVCTSHVYVPLMCISLWLNDKRVTAYVDATLNLFLFPSVREYMERSSQASRHPLRNARKSALLHDRLLQRLSGLKRCRCSSFGVQRVFSSRLLLVFRFGHSGRTL